MPVARAGGGEVVVNIFSQRPSSYYSFILLISPDVSSSNASQYSNNNIQIFPDADGHYSPTGGELASPTWATGTPGSAAPVSLCLPSDT